MKCHSKVKVIILQRAQNHPQGQHCPLLNIFFSWKGQDERWGGECVSTQVCVCVFLLFSAAAGTAGYASDTAFDASWTVFIILIALFHWSNPLVFPRTSRFASFPEYLVVQIKKFTFGLDWVPKKFGRYLLHAFAWNVRLAIWKTWHVKEPMWLAARNSFISFFFHDSHFSLLKDKNIW